MTPDRLRAIAFWAGELTGTELERACRGLVEKTWPAGATIVHRGDAFEYWTGVVSGLVKISSVSSSGKAVSLAGMPAGMWFGEGSMLKGERRQYDLVTLRESRLAMMNRTTFAWLFENSVGFNRFLVRQFNAFGQGLDDHHLQIAGRGETNPEHARPAGFQPVQHARDDQQADAQHRGDHPLLHDMQVLRQHAQVM